MKILIACEFSGVVRDEFIKLGHDAMSCDILPTEKSGPHYQGNLIDILSDGWDLIIAHPPCTYLANSGVRWLHTDPSRWSLLDDSCKFFKAILDSNIPKICIENPIPHKYAVERIGQKYTQIIHPWEHGHGESKATCLWLKGLKLLTPSDIVEGREQRVWKLPPSKNRWKERSRTYPGIAKAMATQWGEY